MRRFAIFLIDTVILAVVASVLGIFSRQCAPTTPHAADTVVIHDTTIIKEPYPVESLVVRYKYIKVPVVIPDNDSIPSDSVPLCDSVGVVLPITQKEYQDSTYHAWVSGYEPNLDSIHVYSKTRNIFVPVAEKQKRWGLGIQLGLGITPHKVQPYLGIGVQYNFLFW